MIQGIRTVQKTVHLLQTTFIVGIVLNTSSYKQWPLLLSYYISKFLMKRWYEVH